MKYWDGRVRDCPGCGRPIRGLPGFMRHVYRCVAKLRAQKGLKERRTYSLEEMIGCMTAEGICTTALAKALAAKHGGAWIGARGQVLRLRNEALSKGAVGFELAKTARGGGWLFKRKVGEIESLVGEAGISVPELYAKVGEERGRAMITGLGLEQVGRVGEWELVVLDGVVWLRRAKGVDHVDQGEG